jgi:ubiquinone/menaquinone biosynthesis C-methylase UbiE
LGSRYHTFDIHLTYIVWRALETDRIYQHSEHVHLALLRRRRAVIPDIPNGCSGMACARRFKEGTLVGVLETRMAIQAAYNEWSSTYDSDSNATRDLDRVVTEWGLGTSRFASVIEIGCGTGKNTRLLSQIGTRVLALDFSDSMLAHAQRKLRDIPNVVFSLADITTGWPCATRSVHLVTCNLVLEHNQDMSPVFTEAARVLVGGGWLFICELHPCRQYQGTVANYQRGTRRIQVAAFVHHISDFLEAAQNSGFTLTSLREWWHENDDGKAPRLVSFLFERGA